MLTFANTERFEYFHPAWLTNIYYRSVVSISHGIDVHTPLQVSRLGVINSSPLVAQFYITFRHRAGDTFGYECYLLWGGGFKVHGTWLK